MANPKTVRIDCVRITPGAAGEPLVLPLGSGNSAQVLVRACGRPAATTSGSAGDSWAGRCLFRQRRDQQSNYHQHRAADCSGGLQAFSLKKFGRRGRARSASVCEFRKKSAASGAFAAPPLCIPRLSTRSLLGAPIMSNIYLDNRSLTLMPFCLDLIEIQTTKSSGVSN
jgi:hypothetical protein